MEEDNTSTEGAIVVDDTSTQDASTETEAIETDLDSSGFWEEDGDETQEDGETDKPDEEESEGKEESEETDGQESDESKQEDESPQDRARREYQERQAARAESQAQQNDINRKQAQEYLEQAEDDKDAAIRQLQLENYYTRVQQTETSIAHDFEVAQSEIDMFNPENEQFNQAALQDALSVYERAHIQMDGNGNVVGYDKPLRQHLQERADFYRGFIQAGSRVGQQAERKMRERAAPLPTRPPQKGVLDEKNFIENFFD